MPTFNEILNNRKLKNQYQGYEKYANISDSGASFDSVMSKRAKRKIEDKLQALGTKANSLYKEYNSRYFDKDGNYIDAYKEDSEEWKNSVAKQTTSLDSDAREIGDILIRYKDSFDDDTFSKLSESLQKEQDKFLNISKQAVSQNELFSNYSSDEEYQTAKKDYDFREKWGNKTYDEILEVIDWNKKNPHSIDRLKLDELEWLEAYAPTIKYDKYSLEELEQMRDEAEKDKNDNERNIFGKVVDWVALGDPNALNRGSIDYFNEVDQAYNNRLFTDIEHNADFEKESQYKPSEENLTKSFLDYGKVEDVLAYISDVSEKKHIIASGENWQKYDYMEADEVKKLNYLYNTKGEKAAQKYLDYISSTLNERMTSNAIKGVDKFATEHPNIANVTAHLTNLASARSLPEDLYKTFKGEEIDTNSASHLGSKITQTIRSNVGKQMGETDILGGVLKTEVFGKPIGEIIYGAGTSIGDMLIDIGLAGTVGMSKEASGKVVQTIMSSQAAANGVIEAKERGLSDAQAVNLGIINGAVEWLTEKYSIEAFLGDPTSTVGYLTKNIIAEGTEEPAATALNTIADMIVSGDKSEFISNMNNYEKEGQNKTEAFKSVLFDLANQMGTDFIAGAISGGVMGGIGKLRSDIPLSRIGKSVFNKNNLGELIELGINADPSSDFYKLATKISQSKNVTNADIGKLQTAATEHSGAEVRNVENKKMTEATANRLVELGAEPEKAENLANIVLKSYRGEVLTAEESDLLANSKEANKAVSELVNEGEEYSSDWVSAVKKGEDILNVRAQARKILNFPKIKKVSISENGINVSDINSVEVKGDEIVVNGQDTNDLSFLNEQTAELVAYSSNYGSAAQHFIDTYKLQPTEDVVEFALAYDLAHDYGKVDGINLEYAQNNPELSALSAEQIEAAYKAGETAAQLKQSQTVFKKRKNKIESGVVKLAPGVSYNSLSSKQKASIRALRSLSGLTGIRFEVFRSQMDSNGEYTGENGSYKNGTIRLDINAGKDNFFDGEVAIISTASHELTHFLRQYDPAGYKALQTFVIEHIGKDITELANKHIAEYASQGKEIDFEDAVEEIVAESCTQMLKDSSALEKLAKENRTLFEKIVDFLKELFRDIRKAYEGTALTPEAEAMLNHMDELQKLWDASLVKAVENYKSNKAIKKSTDKNGGVKYCVRNNNKNEFNPDGKTLKEQLQEAFDTSISKERRYVYVGKFTQEFVDKLKNHVKVEDFPIVMNYRDAYLSMENKERGKYHGDGINYHNLGVDGLEAALKSFDDPEYVLLSNTEGKIELILEGRDYKNRQLFSIIEINTIAQHNKKFLRAHVVNSVYGNKGVNNRIALAKKENRVIYNKNEESTQGMPQVRYERDINVNSSNNRLSQKPPIVNSQYMQKSDNDTEKLSIRRRNDAYTALGEMKTLEKRNQKIEQDVAELRQLLALQKKATHSNELNPRQLRITADIIRKHC